MEKINQKNLLLEIAEQNGEIKYSDNKTLAKLEWLRLWEKNPKIVFDKDLSRLEKQVEELGIYKPLIIYLEKDNAVILGGNQRYKVLTKLRKKYQEKNSSKYEYVWVSVVNAESDVDKIKYALSDNEQIGKYTRDQLHKVLEPFLEQPNLFQNYNIEMTDSESINEFIDDLALDERDLQSKDVERKLKKLGINDETINMISSMVRYNKEMEKLPDINIKGKISKQRFPLLFWVDDEVLFQQLHEIFDTKLKDNHNTAKLKEFCEKVLNTKLPTSVEKLEKLLKEIKSTDEKIIDSRELGGNEVAWQLKKKELLEEFKKLYEQYCLK